MGQLAVPAERATRHDHSSLGPKHTCHVGEPGDSPASSAGFWQIHGLSSEGAPGGLASCA